MKLIVLGACFFVAILAAPFAQACPLASTPDGEKILDVTLRTQSRLRFEVTVTNVNRVAVHWIRPPGVEIGLYGGWGGWAVSVTGGGRAWQPYVFPGGMQPVDVAHCHVLRPGESGRFILDLEHWVAQDVPMIEAPGLARTAGQYELTLTYNTPAKVYAGHSRFIEAGRELTLVRGAVGVMRFSLDKERSAR